MGVDPPPDLEKFRSKDHVVDLCETSLTQKDSSQNSKQNSGNLQKTAAITVAYSHEQTARSGEIISTSNSVECSENPIIGDDRSTHELQHIKKSEHSPVAIENNSPAKIQEISGKSPELRSQIRHCSGINHGGAPTGVCSAPPELAPKKISASLDGELAGGALLSSGAGAPVNFSDQDQCHLGHLNETSLPIQKSSIDAAHSSSNFSFRLGSIGNLIGNTIPMDGETNSQCQPDHSTNEDSFHQKTSSNAQLNCPTLNSKLLHVQEPKVDQAAPVKGNQNHSKDQDLDFSKQQVNAAAGKSPNLTGSMFTDTNIEAQLQSTAIEQNTLQLTSLMQQRMKNSKGHIDNNNWLATSIDPKSTDGTSNKDDPSQHGQRTDLNYNNGKGTDMQQRKQPQNINVQSSFPKVSSNFDSYIPPPQKNSQAPPTDNTTENNNTQPTSIDTNTKNHNPRNKLISDPAAPTVYHNVAARIRENLAKKEVHIVFSTPSITTKQGYPAVIFKKEDFMVKLAARCKYTLVGKFINSMPKMEVIRKSFIQQTHLKGGVKIAHFNARHIYIDLDNEEDHLAVWTKQKMYIEGQMMRLQVWTPTFRPEEETPIVPIWVTLPELPWHCYCTEVLSILLSPIGKLLYLDNASLQKTRGSVAKVRMQIDITKERPPHLWMGYDDEDLTKGRWQALQYEGIPEYCSYCKHQGHVLHACNMKRRDDEIKSRKEQEAEAKLKNKQMAPENKQSTGGKKDTNIQGKAQQNEKQQVQASTSGTKVSPQQTQQEHHIHEENQWKTQRRKNFKGPSQDGQNKKTSLQVFKPVSPQKHGDNVQQTKEALNSGIDSMLPHPHASPNNIFDVLSDSEVDGGEDGGIEEKTTNLQEGVSKGGDLSHVLHENPFVDHRIDSRAPATTFDSQNNQPQDVSVVKEYATAQGRDSGQSLGANRVQNFSSMVPVSNQNQVATVTVSALDIGSGNAQVLAPSLVRNSDANLTQFLTPNQAQKNDNAAQNSVSNHTSLDNVLGATSVQKNNVTKAQDLGANQVQKVMEADQSFSATQVHASEFVLDSVQVHEAATVSDQGFGSEYDAAQIQVSSAPDAAQVHGSAAAVHARIGSTLLQKQGMGSTLGVDQSQKIGEKVQKIIGSDQVTLSPDKCADIAKEMGAKDPHVSGDNNAQHSVLNQQCRPHQLQQTRTVLGSDKTIKRREARKKKQQILATETSSTSADCTVDKGNSGQLVTNSCSHYVLLDQVTPIRTPDFVHVEDPPNITPINVGSSLTAQQQDALRKANECVLNTAPSLPPEDETDEYRVIHSEDEFDKEFQGEVEQEDDDEAAEHLVKAVGPTRITTRVTDEEMNQLAGELGLSPRGIHHNPKTTTISAPLSRPKTRSHRLKSN